MVDDLIFALPATALEALAKHHGALARRFTDAARERRKKAEMHAHIEKRQASLYAIPEVVASLMRDGLSQDMAEAEAALRFGVPLVTVHYHLKLAAKKQAAQDRAARDREVMRLAGLGWTNAQIADKMRKAGLPLHPGSVSRIVQKQLQENRPCSPASATTSIAR